MRFDLRTRAKMLEAGTWQTSDGRFVKLREMAPEHLINALLKALSESEPACIWRPLAQAVHERGLAEKAASVAEQRMSSSSGHGAGIDR